MAKKSSPFALSCPDIWSCREKYYLIISCPHSQFIIKIILSYFIFCPPHPRNVAIIRVDGETAKVCIQAGFGEPKAEKQLVPRAKIRIFCKKNRRNFCTYKKSSIFAALLRKQPHTGHWCNGNTTDSGPVIPGSSPGCPASRKERNSVPFCFCQHLFLNVRVGA